MFRNKEIQTSFFEKIKEKMDPNLSLVHEVSEKLEISYDSAYRRLRGEKKLYLEEAIILSRHFGISITDLIQPQINSMIFKAYHVEPDKFNSISWLDNILQSIQKIALAPDKQIVYAAKDPPIFQYLQFPDIVSFKFFFWEKTLFHSKDLINKKFKAGDISKEMRERCNLITSLSLKIPTIEIWNEDTFRILLRQIEYYYVSGYFESTEDLILLLESIEQWLHHNQKEAELGFRYIHGTTPKGIEGSYILYENEIVINDNTIHISIGNKCFTYFTYNVLGLLCSDNTEFCQGISNFHKTIMSKSNLISSVGEKERNKFFNKLHRNIDSFRKTHNL